VKHLLFNVWWLVMVSDGLIALVCARGFWQQRRGNPAAFWTAAMLFCLSAEAFSRGVTAPFMVGATGLDVGGLAVAVAGRTVKAVGIWLWWLKVFPEQAKLADTIPPEG
jgi:hypothetical protein